MRRSSFGRLAALAAWAAVLGAGALMSHGRAAGGDPAGDTVGRVEVRVRSRPAGDIFLDGRYLGRVRAAFVVACDPIDGGYLGVLEPQAEGEGILEVVLGSEKAAYLLARQDLSRSCGRRQAYHTLFFDFRRGTVTLWIGEDDAGMAAPIYYGDPRAILRDRE